MEEQIERIRKYLANINPRITEIEFQNKGLIDFVISEVIDRVSLYLNRDIVPIRVERIIANIVNTNLGKVLAMINTDDGVAPKEIKTISDNGQSITYDTEVRRYFASSRDEAILSGFTSLLARYRRVRVVHSSSDEASNL
jgi:hypothetical protein